MKLEWFRHHKKFVYWVLLPVVGIGMAFFGATAALEKNTSRKVGPSVTLRVGNTERYMSPSEVIAARTLLTQYFNRGQVSSDQAAMHQIIYHTAHSSGFELGETEKLERMREEVKGQVQRRDGTQLPQVTDTVYKKLLNLMQLTPAQFDRLTHEMGVQQKYFEYLAEQSEVSDAQLFAEYVQDKEVARLRFKTLKSEDFISKAEAPTEDKIKEFYEKNKTNVRELKDVMFTKPKMSADLLFLDTEKLFGGGLKPTEDELKKFYETVKSDYKIPNKAGEPAPAAGQEKYKPFEEVKAELEKKWQDAEIKSYYERYKQAYWKVDAKPGEKPATPGEQKFKPFDEVKADVEKKWKDDEKRRRPMVRMNALKTELQEAEKAHNEGQAGKPEKERTPFDVAAWAKSKDLAHWVSGTLTEAEFKAGKAEVNAKDATWVANLFSLKQESSNPYLTESNKRREKEFSYPQVMDKGVVMTRIKEYQAEQVKPLEEAKPAVIERMKVLNAVELAEAEAKKIHDDWAAGNNPPKIEELDEIRGDNQHKHALLKKFFEKPKPIGEAIDVASAKADENPDSTNPQKRFHIGFAVERELPKWTGFHQDTEWKRDDNREQIAQSNAASIRNGLFRQMKDMAKVDSDIEDPPLFDRVENDE